MSVSSNPNWIISADNFQSVHHYIEETEKVLSQKTRDTTDTDG